MQTQQWRCSVSALQLGSLLPMQLLFSYQSKKMCMGEMNGAPSGRLLLLKRRQQAGLRVAAAALRPWLLAPVAAISVRSSLLSQTGQDHCSYVALVCEVDY